MSTRSIEEVAAVSDGPKWVQVYTWKDRGLVRELVERAAAAGYEALWLTVDTAVLGPPACAPCHGERYTGGWARV